MSLLSVVQEFSKRTGLSIPGSVVSTSNKQVLQMWGLLEEILEDVSITRANWTKQNREATFSSVAAEDQGFLETLAPGYIEVLTDTMFNRTSKLPITGPLTPEEWQHAQAVVYTSAYHSFRIKGGKLFIYPALGASESIAFEYTSSYLVYDSSTTDWKRNFTADSDTFALDESILIRGLRMLWKREKGLPYSEEMRDYERVLQKFEGVDGVKPDLHMDSGPRDRIPGIIIPDSSWPL